MITTNEYNDTTMGTSAPLVLIDPSSRAKPTPWHEPITHWIFVKSWFIRKCFCLDDDLLQDVELDGVIRNSIRDQLVTHHSGTGRHAIVEAIRNVYDTTGYDMSNLSSSTVTNPVSQPEQAVTPCVSPKGTPKSNSSVASHGSRGKRYRKKRKTESVDSVPLSPPVIPTLPMSRGALRVVPRFAAAVVLALRAKFGKLALNEANRLLVEREYLKTCRDLNVRNNDIELHRQFVANSYFMETVTDEVATVRTRLPKWLREAFGSKPSVPPTIC